MYLERLTKKLTYGHYKYISLRLLEYKIEQRIRNIQMIHKLLNHPKHKMLIHSILVWYQLC